MLQPQVTQTSTETLLEVEGLTTYFFLRGGILKAVDGVSFALKPRETLAIVGEVRLRQVDDRALADAADPGPARQDRRRFGQARRD